VDSKETDGLLDLILQGDEDRYEELMKAYQVKIFNYCYHILGHQMEAEDATQEVFIKAYRNLKKYKREIPFAAWLYKIAYNHCMDVLRKRKWSRFLPFLQEAERGESHIDIHIEDVYFSEPVYLAMATLSVEERTLLILRGVEEKTYEEISQIMNKNAASLRKKFERTAVKFRTAYVPLEKGGAKHAESARLT